MDQLAAMVKMENQVPMVPQGPLADEVLKDPRATTEDTEYLDDPANVEKMVNVESLDHLVSQDNLA